VGEIIGDMGSKIANNPYADVKNEGGSKVGGFVGEPTSDFGNI
jgi:hypothetical protein